MILNVSTFLESRASIFCVFLLGFLCLVGFKSLCVTQFNKKCRTRRRFLLILAHPEDSLGINACGAFVSTRTALCLFSFIHGRTLWSGSNPCVVTRFNKKCRIRRHFLLNSGASRRIRTLSLLIRSQMLYPVKLWMQRIVILYLFILIASFFFTIFIVSCICRGTAHYSVRDILIYNCCRPGRIGRLHG